MPDFSAHHRHTGGHATLEATEEFVGRTQLRFARALSRGGLCEFEVYDPTTPPAVDSYLEIRYGSDVAWTGTIREAVEREDEPGRWRVVGADALAIVQRRRLTTRHTYTSTDERGVVLDILTRIGITTTSSPIRVTSTSILGGFAGNAIDSYRVEYDGGLAALQQLAVAYNRVITVKREQDAGTWYWVLYFAAAITLFSGAVQGTWTAGSEVDELENITDSWDKTGSTTVLGEGHGATGSSGAGGASDPRAVVPLRGLQSGSVAASAAGTLQSAFGSDRRVLLGTLQWQDPKWEGDTVLEGEIVTLRDRDGVSIGDFRVIHTEVDEDLLDGWPSRCTFIPTGTPILPAVTDGAALREPGLVDLEELTEQQLRHAHIQPQLTALDVTRTIHPDATDGYSETINLATSFNVDDVEYVVLRFQIPGTKAEDYYWHLRLLDGAGLSVMPDGPVLDYRKSMKVDGFNMGGVTNFSLVQLYYTIPRSQLTAGATVAKLQFAIGSTEAAPGTDITVALEVTATKRYQAN